ncbi:hypothetical protein ACM55F_10020 [Flavobacterium sp. XS2P12]|uniref:hypothetical protein n=1 Tax=Flavobacterium melibiosi TaxID=3398734 RepID=UPI003A87D5B2
MYNSVFFHTVLAFLAIMSDNLTMQLRGDANNKKVILTPQILEIKKRIEGGGTIDLIDATTQRVDGICTFDKNTLETGRAVVFDEISLGYRSHADMGKEGALAYNISLPAELQNATLIISQNGKEVLRMPAIDITNLTAGQNASDQYTKLKSLILLADAKTITIQLKFAPGVTLAAGTNHYVYLRLSGLQTALKS